MSLTDLRRRWYLLDTDGEAPEPVKRITKADGRITRRAQEVVAPASPKISRISGINKTRHTVSVMNPNMIIR